MLTVGQYEYIRIAYRVYGTIRGTPYLFIVDYKLQLSYERLWQE